MLTNVDAPNFKLISYDVYDRNVPWTTIIAEHNRNLLHWVQPIDDELMILAYVEDVKVCMSDLMRVVIIFKSHSTFSTFTIVELPMPLDIESQSNLQSARSPLISDVAPIRNSFSPTKHISHHRSYIVSIFLLRECHYRL